MLSDGELQQKSPMHVETSRSFAPAAAYPQVQRDPSFFCAHVTFLARHVQAPSAGQLSLAQQGADPPTKAFEHAAVVLPFGPAQRGSFTQTHMLPSAAQ